MRSTGTFSKSSSPKRGNKREENDTVVLVTEGDEMFGFYAARACLSSRKFEKVVVSVHDKTHEFAKTLEREGAHIKEWDLKNKNSIRHCLQGVDCMVLVPHPSWDVVDKTRNILEVIEKEQEERRSDEDSTEIQKLVFWGPLFAALDDERRRLDHKNVVKIASELERLIKKGPVEDWTICRLGFIMQGLFALSEVIQNRGIIPLATGEGEFAPVNLKDCAHATVNILAEWEEEEGDENDDNKRSRRHHKRPAPRRPTILRRDDNDDDDNNDDEYEQQILTFTSSQLVTGEQLAERASRGLGGSASLKFEPVSLDEMREILESEAEDELNAFQIEGFLMQLELIEKDKLAIRSNDLHKVLKREPATVERFFREHASQFQPRGGRLAQMMKEDY